MLGRAGACPACRVRALTGIGVYGFSESAAGVVGNSSSTSQPGVYGVSEKSAGVVGRSQNASQPGVFGVCEQMTGVAGRSTAKPGVFGQSIQQAGVVGTSTFSSGVFGIGNAPFQPLGPPAGVFGVNDKSVGVLGSSLDVIGVWGNTHKGLAVVGTTTFGVGVPTDRITDQGIGVMALPMPASGSPGWARLDWHLGSSATGLAGHFKGAVTIEGDLTVIGVKQPGVPLTLMGHTGSCTAWRARRVGSKIWGIAPGGWSI